MFRNSELWTDDIAQAANKNLFLYPPISSAIFSSSKRRKIMCVFYVCFFACMWIFSFQTWTLKQQTTRLINFWFPQYTECYSLEWGPLTSGICATHCSELHIYHCTGSQPDSSKKENSSINFFKDLPEHQEHLVFHLSAKIWMQCECKSGSKALKTATFIL